MRGGHSVWLAPSILSIPEGEVDHAALFAVNREATAKVIRKAMRNEPTIDWLLANQETVTHCFHQLGLEGKPQGGPNHRGYGGVYRSYPIIQLNPVPVSTKEQPCPQ